MTDLNGTIGDDTFAGTSSADHIDLSQGGEDSVFGGAGGGDSFIMGAALSAGDRLSADAAGGTNIVTLAGDYSAGLTVTGEMLDGFDLMTLAAGSSYRLAMADSLVTSDDRFEVWSSGDLVLDASAATQTGYAIRVTGARYSVVGGAQHDTLNLVGAPDRADSFDGGDGDDWLTLTFDGGFRPAAHSLVSVERLYLAGDISIVLNDATLAAGGMMLVQAASGGTIHVDGHKESDGQLQLTGQNGDDVLIGGKLGDRFFASDGDDTLTGGLGADTFQGSQGADTFEYDALHDSWKRSLDFITDLDRTDTIDLSRVDADKFTAGDQAFHLVSAFTGQAGELMLTYNAAQNETLVLGDTNGNGKADLMIHIADNYADFTNFVL